MVIQIEAEAPGLGHARRCASECHPSDPASLTSALVVSLEQALDAARSLLTTLESATDHPMQAARPTATIRRDGLSRREAEVLQLLTTGRSNRQIAAALFLSPRTVQRHVANLYLKIGTHCRAEATAYALRHGLACADRPPATDGTSRNSSS